MVVLVGCEGGRRELFYIFRLGEPLDVPFCIGEKDEQIGLGRKTAFICLTLCKKQDFKGLDQLTLEIEA